jgi:S-DNA-T family DNA segregation ATPase FtsK/SpoIIIE
VIKEWFAKQRMGPAVFQVFKNGELGITYSYGQNNGKIYPKIRKVQLITTKEQRFVISLFLRNGSKEIKKKEYCFQQVFGHHIELKGEVKEFKLTVYASTFPIELTYDYEIYLNGIAYRGRCRPKLKTDCFRPG